MKKRLITSIVAATLLSVGASAQSSKFNIGIEAGPNIGLVHYNDFNQEHYKTGLGFSGGVSFQYNFPKLFSIRTKVAYESKVVQSSFTFTDQNGNELNDARLLNQFNYIAIPVVARITLGNKFKFFADVGGFLGVLISNKAKYRGFGDQLDGDYENTPNMNRIDAGTTIGVGCGYELTKNLLLSINVRNNLGLVNMKNQQSFAFLPMPVNAINSLVGIDYCFGTRE